MPRKKKEIEVYTNAGLRDNLVKISIKHNVPLEELRRLNPDIRNIIMKISSGKAVRIK